MPLEANRRTPCRLPAGPAARAVVEGVQPEVSGALAGTLRGAGCDARGTDRRGEVEGVGA